MSPTRRFPLVVAAAAITMAASACGSPAETAACADVQRIMASSSLHVLPGAEVTYEHSPPAGGPHQLPGPDDGAYAQPVDEPLQVAAVEAGKVLIQYQDSLDEASVRALESLAAQPDVIVAPGIRPFDEGAEVAYTSWGRRQLCTTADQDAAQAFIDAFAGAVFIEHGDTTDNSEG